MTTPQITPPGTPPDPLAPQPTFRATFYSFLQALVASFGQANTVATWMATTKDDVASNATTASNAATSASAAANYQGDYDAGTLYAIGESVTYSGDVYQKKSTAAAGTTPVDGSDWRIIVTGISADFQEFTSSGTWTKPSNASFVYIEAVGGGGGGGSCDSISRAGGGAGGGGIIKTMPASDLGATETVTIGAGGAGGSSGIDEDGSEGGGTSFGSHFTARGGSGGEAGPDGDGGSPAWSAISNPMQNASNDIYNYVSSPFGGHGFGQSGRAGPSIYGGGGGGSDVHGGGSSVFAGAGGSGTGVDADGVAPGGGGAAGQNSAGGDGADGRVRVWAW